MRFNSSTVHNSVTYASTKQGTVYVTPRTIRWGDGSSVDLATGVFKDGGGSGDVYRRGPWGLRYTKLTASDSMTPASSTKSGTHHGIMRLFRRSGTTVTNKNSGPTQVIQSNDGDVFGVQNGQMFIDGKRID